MQPREAAAAHRPWSQMPDALDDTMARRDARTLSKAPTFRTDGTVSCVKTKDARIVPRGAKFERWHRLNGPMSVHDKDRILPVTALQTYPVPEPAEDEKTIDPRIESIVALQRTTPRQRPAPGRG